MELTTRAKNVIRWNLDLEPDADLSVREAMRLAGRFDKKEILMSYNCGAKTAAVIEDWLAQFGLKLGMINPTSEKAAALAWESYEYNA